MKKGVRRVVVVAGAVSGLLLGIWGWATWRAASLRAVDRPFEPRAVPVPWPREGLAPHEAERVAIDRGRALYQGRYGCVGCHREDLAGGGVIPAWPLMRPVASNITPAGVTAAYRPEDWDALIRHGMRPDGLAALMPVMELHRMSDQELSDLIAYARSVPGRDDVQEVSTVQFAGALAISLGLLHYSAAEVDHAFPHRAEPPDDPVALGAHIAQACEACHRADLSGGPVEVGAPDWPPAANLTPHAEGLADWTEADLTRLIRTGVRPDGSAVHPSMPWEALAGMEERDLAALWAYLRTVPPRPTGK